MRITEPQKAADVLREFLAESGSAVALTGAGISTASGIPDFRGPSGLFSIVSQRVFEIDFFMSQPAEYYKIAIEHIHPIVDRQPSRAHILLARLEEQKIIKAVITQNIDGLHQKAGSKNVIEFHGNAGGFYCESCECTYECTAVDAMIRDSGVPRCTACAGLIRPAIVFYGDPIPADALWESETLAAGARLLWVLGSSLTVNPAAGLAYLAKNAGAKLVITTQGHTPYDPLADVKIECDLEALAEQMLTA